MKLIPKDMLFYYEVPCAFYYFSACYWIKQNKMQVVEIESDEFWNLVMSGELKMQEVSPDQFGFPVSPKIIGNVKVFEI